MDENEEVDIPHANRRRLTPEELDSIKEQLLESIYADIGRSFVKKLLWIIGSVGAAVVVGLNASRWKIGG